MSAGWVVFVSFSVWCLTFYGFGNVFWFFGFGFGFCWAGKLVEVPMVLAYGLWLMVGAGWCWVSMLVQPC